MKRFTAFVLLSICMALLFSSCGLFRKSQSVRIPPPVRKEPLPQEKPAVPEKEVPPPPFGVPAFAKKIYKPVYNIALFTPLYTDQVTSDTGFSVNDRTPLPASSLAGLEFYEGALLAMDSLQQEGVTLRLYVYDTKSNARPLSAILQSSQLDSANLIIGSVNSSEMKEISHFARQKQINFISATYPNDAGISGNPFLTILNSTLRIHCTAIQNFAQRKFSNKNILVIHQNNAQEKQNLKYLEDAYRQMSYAGKSPLHPFTWSNNTTADDLLSHLDKNKTNVIILTPLYPQVALSIIGQLVPLTKDYIIKIVGMPTLDGNRDLRKPDYKGISIYYSTPYPYNDASDNPAIRSMMWQFFRKYRSRPSDMALKGYETLFYFGTLLHKNGQYFNADLNDPAGRLLTQYNLTPVYKDEAKSNPPDYFENTHLYFMQVWNGKVMPVH